MQLIDLFGDRFLNGFRGTTQPLDGSFEWAQPLALFDKIRAPALTQVLEETKAMAGADSRGCEQSQRN